MDIQSIILAVLCMLLKLDWVHGACGQYSWPTASAITADGTIQTLQSANYPNPYINDQRCAWHVTAPVESKIIIYIQDFSSEGPKTPCTKDYATIYDGPTTTDPEIFRVCPATANQRKVYISSTNEIYVTFESDAFLTYSGISIAVFTNDTSNQPNCSTTLSVTTEPQYLLSNNLAQPYVPNFDCSHTFELDADSFHTGIQFYFYFMDIEVSASCTEASVTIAGGSDAGSLHTAYTLCETSDTFIEAAYNVKGNVAQLNFTTSNNINTSIDYYGYFITYQTTFVGLYLNRPGYNETVNMTLSELTQLGNLDSNNGTIEANATGNLMLEVLVNGTQNALFSYDNTSAPEYHLTLANLLDYETAAFYQITVKLSSSDAPAPEDTATVYFNVYIEDADDIAPVFANLPADLELLRSRKTGYLLYTLNATDGDASASFSVVVYGFQNEPQNIFTINETTGEIKLSVDADTIAISLTNYQVTAIAYSVSTSSSLATTGILNITIPPDSPPVCNETYVYAETVTIAEAIAGTAAPYVTGWNCTDEYNLTYSLGTVTPTVSSTLFAVDSQTGAISLVRSFTVAEVPDRKFYLEIVVTDSINQTTNFTAQVNVTNLRCYPSPRKLYARMGQGPGAIVLYDFNCSSTVNMTYTLTQFPANTFNISYIPDGVAWIVLNIPVFKIKFYSLSVYMTNGLDDQTLNFVVTVQFEKCGITSNSAPYNVVMTVLIIVSSLICFLFSNHLT